MAKVLFVCIGNQGRSVLAERLFRESAEGRHEARSAGPHPGTEAHLVVLEALREVGIDVATCEGACPVTPGKRRFDWHLGDPMHEPLNEVRALREDVRKRVGALLAVL